MGIFGDTAGPPVDSLMSKLTGAPSMSWSGRKSWTGRKHVRAWAGFPRLLALLAVIGLAGALTGCGSFDGGQLLIDPGRYSIFKCDDLAKRWKTVTAREKDLRELMARASQTGGGAVVGSVAYRADYDAVLSDERLLQHTATEKNCPLPYPAGGALQSGPLQPGQPSAGPPQVAQPQAAQPQAAQPLAGQVPSGGPSQSTVYQSDQSIR
jgi:hypothetical protein